MQRINTELFAILKSSLRTIWPAVGSSHADEALAAYFGHRTYASLRAAMPRPPDFLDVEPDGRQLLARMEALGHHVASADLDRILRLFHSEMMGRLQKTIAAMVDQTANDN